LKASRPGSRCVGCQGIRHLGGIRVKGKVESHVQTPGISQVFVRRPTVPHGGNQHIIFIENAILKKQ